MPTRSKINVPIICNANQARSVVATSFLQEIYPEFNFKSYGTNAMNASKIPQSTIDVLDNWRLPLKVRMSINVRKELTQLTQSEVVIAADAKVADELFRLGIGRETVWVVDSLNLPPLLTPIDPLSLTSREFEIELAKFAFSASILFSQMIYQKSSILTFVPWDHKQIEPMLHHCIDIMTTNTKIVIDVSGESHKPEILRLNHRTVVTLRVNPDQIIEEIERIKKKTGRCMYYLSVNVENFHELLSIRREISCYGLFAASNKISLMVVTGPIFRDGELEVKSLLNTSVVNGRIRLFMPREPLTRRDEPSKEGAK